MALITCTECGKEFSDRAATCPNCGCPTEDILADLSAKQAAAENNAAENAAFELHFTDLKGVSLDVKDERASISRGRKVLKEAPLSRVLWLDFVDAGPTGKGSITIFMPYEYYKKLTFGSADTDTIRNFMSHTKSKRVVPKPPKLAEGTYCPYCGSTQIFIANTKTKTTLNLNPLKPFTLTNHKTTKEMWACGKCGKRWEKKV